MFLSGVNASGSVIKFDDNPDGVKDGEEEEVKTVRQQVLSRSLYIIPANA